MESASTVVYVDDQGRCYIPKTIREELGITGDQNVRIEVSKP